MDETVVALFLSTYMFIVMQQKIKHLEVMIEMEHSLTELNDLPDEILVAIFQKLNNISLLHSLMGLNRRLNTIICDPIFTSHLSLMKQMSDDSVHSLTNSILDRFCSEILPEIYCNIKWLDLEASSMERIFLATDYPNLCRLGLFDVSVEKAVSLFTSKKLNFSVNWKKKLRMKFKRFISI